MYVNITLFICINKKKQGFQKLRGKKKIKAIFLRQNKVLFILDND